MTNRMAIYMNDLTQIPYLMKKNEVEIKKIDLTWFDIRQPMSMREKGEHFYWSKDNDCNELKYKNL